VLLSVIFTNNGVFLMWCVTVPDMFPLIQWHGTYYYILHSVLSVMVAGRGQLVFISRAVV